MSDLSELRKLMRMLRDPRRGCPWDLAQTYATIVPHTLEEAYEVAHAIEAADFAHLPDELGDLLFQVVFYCQLAEEEGRFGFDDVVDAICRKLVNRHPHVFGAARIDDAVEVSVQWERIKAEERSARGGPASSELDDVPLALPALSRARKIQRRAARVGFDWPDFAGVRAKLDEELAEYDEACARGERGDMADELGDVLFTVVNLSRHQDCDAEAALRTATARFERRFRRLEATLRARGEDIRNMDAAALEREWQAAKREEKVRAP